MRARCLHGAGQQIAFPALSTPRQCLQRSRNRRIIAVGLQTLQSLNLCRSDRLIVDLPNVYRVLRGGRVFADAHHDLSPAVDPGLRPRRRLDSKLRDARSIALDIPP